MKKLLSFVLTICIITSMMTVLSFRTYAAAQYEAEDNDTYSTANIITLNGKTVGNISDYDDKDYYKIVPTANGKISVKFLHTYENSYDDWDVDVVVYYKGEYTTLSSTNIDLNANESISLPYIGAVKNRVYYIVVSRCCSGILGKKYTLKTSFEKSNYYEKELNEVYSTATKINLGKTYSGTINNSYDKDYYKITAPKNGKIALQFLHTYANSYDDWDVDVYMYYKGEYTNLSSYNIDLNGNEKVTLPYIGAVKNRTYFIVVSRCCSGVIGKNYKIKTAFKKSSYIEKEQNDVYSTATAVKMNKTYSGVINNSYDKDYYKIVAPRNGSISIVFKHKYKNSYDDWDVYTYSYRGGQYKELSSTNIDLNSSRSKVLPKIGVKKGRVYYVCVSKCCNGVVGINYDLKFKIK